MTDPCGRNAAMTDSAQRRPRTVTEVVEKFLDEGRVHSRLERWLRDVVSPRAGHLEIAGLTRDEFDAACGGSSPRSQSIDTREGRTMYNQERAFWLGLRHLASALLPPTAEQVVFERKRNVAAKRRKDSCCVYFVEAVGAGLVKIGKATNNPRTRVMELQVGSGHPLRLVHYVSGWNQSEERKLHEKFKHLHVRGEWFRLAPEIHDYIEALRGPDAPT